MSELKNPIREAERYLQNAQIDLDVCGQNQLLEDLLDLMDIEAQKGEPTYPFEEVMRNEFERRGLKYDV